MFYPKDSTFDFLKKKYFFRFFSLKKKTVQKNIGIFFLENFESKLFEIVKQKYRDFFSTDFFSTKKIWKICFLKKSKVLSLG